MEVNKVLHDYQSQLWIYNWFPGFGGDSFIWNLSNSSDDFYKHIIKDHPSSRYNLSTHHIDSICPNPWNPPKLNSVPDGLTDALLKNKKYLIRGHIVKELVSVTYPRAFHMHSYYANEREFRYTLLNSAIKNHFEPVQNYHQRSMLDSRLFVDRPDIDFIKDLFDRNGPTLLFEHYVSGDNSPYKGLPVPHTLDYLSSYEVLDSVYLNHIISKQRFINPTITRSLPISVEDQFDPSFVKDKLPLVHFDADAFYNRAQIIKERNSSLINSFRNEFPVTYNAIGYE